MFNAHVNDLPPKSSEGVNVGSNALADSNSEGTEIFAWPTSQGSLSVANFQPIYSLDTNQLYPDINDGFYESRKVSGTTTSRDKGITRSSLHSPSYIKIVDPDQVVLRSHRPSHSSSQGAPQTKKCFRDKIRREHSSTLQRQPFATSSRPILRPMEAVTSSSVPSSLPASSRRYLLHILQQPTVGCAFGSNLLSRLAIAPPLIVRLQVIDLAGREVNIDDLSPFLVCQVTLSTDIGEIADVLAPFQAQKLDPNSIVEETQTASSSINESVTSEASIVPAMTRRAAANTSASNNRINPPSRRSLYGTLSASLEKLHLPDSNQFENVFIFPEISIRSEGLFKLRVNVLQLPMPQLASSSLGTLLASISTEMFSVVPSSEYVAPPHTDLTRHLSDQGVKLLIPSFHPSNQLFE